MPVMNRLGAVLLIAVVIGLPWRRAVARDNQGDSIHKAHAWSDAAFAKPKVKHRKLETDRRPLAPFSFKYDGKSSGKILDRWKFSTRSTSKDKITIRTNTY